MPLNRSKKIKDCARNVLAILLCTAFCGLSQADPLPMSPACSQASKARPIVGVNRQNLARAANFQSVLKDIAATGVRDVRLGLGPSFSKTIDNISFANRSGLRVLLVVGTWLPQFAKTGATRRAVPKGTNFHSVFGLSDIDVARYETEFRLFLNRLEDAGGRVAAFQIGNEINSPGFNGDLPVNGPGRFLTPDTFESAPEASKVEAGFRQYTEILKRTKSILDDSRYHKEAKIIAAGLTGADATAAEISKARVTFVNFDLALDLFEKYHALEQVDGVAVHIYPFVSALDSTGQSRQLLSAVQRATRLCEKAEQKKPSLSCWITEWGFKAAGDGCNMGDERRFQLTHKFVAALQCLPKARHTEAAYLYDWDDDKDFSVWRCGRLLPGGDFLTDR
jgi:hypothetical protein